MTDIDTTETPRSRTRGIVLALLAGAVALGVLYVVVLNPLLVGDVTAQEPLLPPPPAAAAAVAEGDPPVAAAVTATAPAEAALAPAAPLETFISGTIRSPFQQLAVVGAATDASSSATASTTATGEATATTATTTATTGTTTATTGATAAGGAASTAPAGTHVGKALIRLVGTTTADGVARAHVTVDGVGHMVAAGETFAASYRVHEIQGQCATLGVAKTRFALCAGQELRK